MNVFGRSLGRAAIEQPWKGEESELVEKQPEDRTRMSSPYECSGLATSCSWCAFSLEFPKINK